jgi:transcriptional regulator GlxA family with amidase domain
MINIAILALDNCIHSTVTGPFDILTIADMQAKEIDTITGRFCQVEIVAPDGAEVFSFNALPVSTTASTSDNRHYDVIITPALLGDYQAVIEDKHVTEWLTQLFAKDSQTAL